MSAAFLPLHEAQAICEAEAGQHIDWNGPEGQIVCPGASLHTTRDAMTDCKVVAESLAIPDGTLPPGVYCFHDSCKGPCEELSKRIRSALGRRAPSGQGTAKKEFQMPRPKLAVFNPDHLARIAAKLPGVNEEYLARRSKRRLDNRTPASFLNDLYKPGEKVLIFTDQASQGQYVYECKSPFDARELDHFRAGAKEGVWFLNNPVTGDASWTGKFYPKDHPQAGEKHMSRRFHGSVTDWRYMVLESDKADRGQWLSMLAQLPMPIAAIYTSGSRSIHALIRINAKSKPDWDESVNRVKEGFVLVGGDRKAMSAVRLTRLPLCERLGSIDGATGQYAAYPAPQMQRLLYLNGEADGRPICEMEAA